jgi:hypothetical protein
MYCTNITVMRKVLTEILPHFDFDFDFDFDFESKWGKFIWSGCQSRWFSMHKMHLAGYSSKSGYYNFPY